MSSRFGGGGLTSGVPFTSCGTILTASQQNRHS